MSSSEKRETRICILLESYLPVMGGMEQGAYQLSKNLQKMGYGLIIVTRNPGGLPQVEDHEGTRIYRRPPAGNCSLPRWRFMVTCLPSLLRLRNDWSLLLVPGFRTLGVPAVVTGRLLGRPVILRAESPGELSGAFFDDRAEKLPRALRPLFRAALRIRRRILMGANRFISMSPELTQEFTRCGVPLRKIEEIPQAVDKELFSSAGGQEKLELRRKLDLPGQGALILIFTGRLVEYKGLPELIDAWETLAGRHENIHLVLAGEGGGDMHNCEKRLRESVSLKGLEDSVRFTGRVDNVNEYLKASDIFVFPTKQEAFGISLIEAMACGLPPVAAATGAIPSIISGGRDGLLIPPGDSAALAEAAGELITDKAKREEMGIRAAETVAGSFTWDTVKEKYRQVIEKL